MENSYPKITGDTTISNIEVLWEGTIDGKPVRFAVPHLTEEDLNKPLEKASADPEIDPEHLRKHEQILRAVCEILVEEGIDAIFHGTGGRSFEDDPSFVPGIAVMRGCDRFTVVAVDGNITLTKDPARYFMKSKPDNLFKASLSEPDSITRLVERLKELP